MPAIECIRNHGRRKRTHINGKKKRRKRTIASYALIKMLKMKQVLQEPKRSSQSSVPFGSPSPSFVIETCIRLGLYFRKFSFEDSKQSANSNTFAYFHVLRRSQRFSLTQNCNSWVHMTCLYRQLCSEKDAEGTARMSTGCMSSTQVYINVG